MEKLRTFKEFNLLENYAISNDYLEEVNKYINDPKIQKISNSLISTIPGYLKEKIIRFMESGKPIDIDKITKLIEKYDIFEKVKELYDSGVRNIEDIYKKIKDSILPKNEAFGIGLAWVVIIFLAISAIYIIINSFTHPDRWNRISYKVWGIICIITMILFYNVVLGKFTTNKKDYLEIKNQLKEYNIEVVTYPTTIYIDGKSTKIIGIKKNGVTKIIEYKNAFENGTTNDTIKSGGRYIDDNIKNIFD